MSFQILRSQRVVFPDGIRPASIVIQNGLIHEIASYDAEKETAHVEDVGHAAILPGLVDTHVHLNEPGRTEWEGFETGTDAAAAGGITTLVEMPLNSSPVTTSRAAFEEKLKAAQGKLRVDCGFWGGLVPGNAHQLEELLSSGVLGLKAFLVHSGIDDFGAAREEDLQAAMPLLAQRGLPLLVHAELENESGQSLDKRPMLTYADYLASRPANWEERAIGWMIELCRQTGCKTHIVHLATATALPELRAARDEGLPLTVETCPHYLHFIAEHIPNRATPFKCAPPIRSNENREALWQALHEGTIDLIASDHSPCPPELKRVDEGDFSRAWGGISSLQIGLPVVWSEAQQHGFDLSDIARWMSLKPAQLAGLEKRKGSIEVGKDADLVVFKSETPFQVHGAQLFHRHKLTPYEGAHLQGVVEQTWLRGQQIYRNSNFRGERSGQILMHLAAPKD